MMLGIEIGGTKLQLGVGQQGQLAALRRYNVVAAEGAQGILKQIAAAAPELIAAHGVKGIGIGFGGPVDQRTGRVLKSHHIEGWTEFPLAQWCREQFGLPVAIGNDADVAALAEARHGAGRGCDPVLYLTVGTGIGGGLIMGGRIYRGFGPAALEIGHLRYGPQARASDQILESLSAGWGLVEQARRAVTAATASESQASATDRAAADELLAACGHKLPQLTARHVVSLAAHNPLAQGVWRQAIAALGWAVAQVITLLSPQVVVIGGGVSLSGEELFFCPLREAVQEYVFPPLAGSYSIVPAQLGEEVVIHGALALAEG